MSAGPGKFRFFIPGWILSRRRHGDFPGAFRAISKKQIRVQQPEVTRPNGTLSHYLKAFGTTVDVINGVLYEPAISTVTPFPGRVVLAGANGDLDYHLLESIGRPISSGWHNLQPSGELHLAGG